MFHWESTTSIAVLALLVSSISFAWNYHHSESLFRRQQYPAVIWHFPEVSERESGTALTTYIVNEGPRQIASIFLGLFLCRGFRKEAWCKSDCLEIPIGERLDFVITEELEEDITGRFGDLSRENGWHFNGKPRKYKAIARLEYLPIVADVKPVTRKEYWLISPTVESAKIVSWRVKRIPYWLGFLPWF